jgi:hypothetical protein
MRSLIIAAFLIALAAPAAAQIQVGPGGVHIGPGGDPEYHRARHCRHLREDCEDHGPDSRACFHFRRECGED